MWSLPGTPGAVALALFAAATVSLAGPAQAQGFYGDQYHYNSQTISHGLTLPQIVQPNGQDEIRAADGTSCRSSMASNDAYLDMGALGTPGYGSESGSGTVYARVIMPLGETPKRLDCTALYSLEIERLRHELALMKSGLSGADISTSSAPSAAAPVAQAKTAKPKGWAEDGWTNKGWKDSASKVGALNTEPVAQSIPQPQARSQQQQGEKQRIPAIALNAWDQPIRTASLTPAMLGDSSPWAATVLAEDEVLPWSGLAAEYFGMIE